MRKPLDFLSIKNVEINLNPGFSKSKSFLQRNYVELIQIYSLNKDSCPVKLYGKYNLNHGESENRKNK
jgi:hypothetical protein